MPKQADLAGVAHNIAHHAASGLSYLSPHLAQALHAAGAETTEIDPLSERPYPPNAGECQSLRLALAAMHGFVVTLLETHGFSLADVSSVVLRATPAPWGSGHSLHTRAVVTSAAGRTYDSGWLC
jgi:hypothetical protein